MSTDIIARPASLQAYREVARDAAEDVVGAGDRLMGAVEDARAGAVDVTLHHLDLDRLARQLDLFAAELAGLGAEVGRVGDAFAALDELGGPVAHSTEDALNAELGLRAHVSGPWAFVGGVLRSNTVRLPVTLAGLGLLGQRTWALAQMARAWLRREWLRTVTPLRATAAGLGHLLRREWGAAIPGVRDALARGNRAAAEQTTRLHGALDRAKNGWGTIGRVGRVLGPIGLAGDAYTLRQGSPYDGVRGGVDWAMAGTGLAAGGALALAGLGVVALTPVVATAAVVGVIGATAWGVGNFAWDHRHTIADWGRSGAEAIGNAASAVGDMASSAASSARDAATSALSGVQDRLFTTADRGLASAGRILGFGG